MNKILILFFLQWIVANGLGQDNIYHKQDLKALHWLVGSWERTNVKPGIKAHEEWHLDSLNQLSGLGITMKGDDTLFLEKLAIRFEKGNIYYIADVKENTAPVYFQFTALLGTAFVCENPGHDFPKKIEYSTKDSILTVTTSAKDKSQNYIFSRR